MIRMKVKENNSFITDEYFWNSIIDQYTSRQVA